VKQQRCPVLLYCDEQLAAQCQRQLANTSRDHEILKVLSKLEEKEDGQFRVLIATIKEKMRAVDYRARELGITLIIAKPFDNPREA